MGSIPPSIRAGKRRDTTQRTAVLSNERGVVQRFSWNRQSGRALARRGYGDFYSQLAEFVIVGSPVSVPISSSEAGSSSKYVSTRPVSLTAYSNRSPERAE